MLVVLVGEEKLQGGNIVRRKYWFGGIEGSANIKRQ